MARGNTDTVPAVWHLLIQEEFARRAGPRQLACCVLCCNRDAAGWHGLGPSDWATVFGSSKSSAVLEQRGIQDADPTEDERATSSQTPPPTPRGVWLKLSGDLETHQLGGVGWGGGAGGTSPACAAPGGGGLGGQIRLRATATERLLPARQPLLDVIPS